MSDDPREIVISAIVYATSPHDIARAVETLTRAAAGLALEGLDVCIRAVPSEDESVEEDTP